jgi:hypothetical protein
MKELNILTDIVRNEIAPGPEHRVQSWRDEVLVCLAN